MLDKGCLLVEFWPIALGIVLTNDFDEPDDREAKRSGFANSCAKRAAELRSRRAAL